MGTFVRRDPELTYHKNNAHKIVFNEVYFILILLIILLEDAYNAG